MIDTPVELSLIIPAYNEQDLIISTLEVLVQFLETRIPQFEILVVDDGSRDNTTQINNTLSVNLLCVYWLNQPTRVKGAPFNAGCLRVKASTSYSWTLIYPTAWMPLVRSWRHLQVSMTWRSGHATWKDLKCATSPCSGI
jgi:hypothetical protein